MEHMLILAPAGAGRCILSTVPMVDRVFCGNGKSNMG